MATTAPPGRFVELDALRGLAAIGVMLFHFFLFWKWVGPTLPTWAMLIADWSPLRIVFTGKTTVFFFVLSGLVLTFPYFAGRPPVYRSYVLKRLLRIYLPYLVALGAALALMAGAHVLEGTPPPARTFAGMWAEPVTWRQLLDHVLLVGSYDAHAFNAVIWSLVHEMRISLVIPLLVWCVLRLSWRANVAIGLACSVAGAVLHLLLKSPDIALYKTLPILLMFIVGALISRHLAALVAAYRAAPTGRRAAFSLGALLLYVYSGGLLQAAAAAAIATGPRWITPLHHVAQTLADWTTILGVAGVIVTVLGSRRVGAIMRAPALARLGQVPYGIYLYHLPLLFFLYHAAGATVPLWALYVLTVALTIPLAHLSRRYVELPAAAWAARLTKRRDAEAEPVRAAA